MNCVLPCGRPLLFLTLLTSLGVGTFAPRLHGAAGDELRTALDAFTGEWEGELRVLAIDGFLLKTIQAHRSYRWEGAEQIVETRFTEEDAAYESVSRQFVELGRLHAVVDRTSMPTERFSGEINDDGIEWINVERNRRDFHDRIVVSGGTRTLEATSVEALRLKGVSGLVRLVFTLKPRAPAIASAPSSSGAETAALAARIAALENDLATAREQASATESRATDAVRERDSLRERLQALETAASTARENMRALESERDRLATLVTDLQGRVTSAPAPDALASSESAARAAEARVQEVQREREALAARFEEAERRITALQSDLEKATDRLEAQTADASRAQGDHAALSTRIEQLESERAALDARATAAEQTVERLSAAQTGATGALATLESQLAEARAAADRLRVEAADAARKITDANDRVAGLQAERDAMARRLDEAEKKAAANTDTQSAQAELERRLAARDAELAGLQQRLDQSVRDAETLARTAETARTERTALEARVTELQSREKQLSATAGDAAKLAASLQDITAERDRFAGELEQLRAQQQAMQAELAAARPNAGTESARIKKLETDFAAAVAARASRDSELASVRANINAANNRASDLAHNLKQAENAATQTRARLEQLQRDNEALMRKAEDAGGETDRLVLRISELESALKTAEQAKAAALTNDEARGQIEERATKLEADLAVAVAERDERDKELATLRADIAAAQGRAGELAASLDQSESAKNALSARLDQLQRDNETLSRQVSSSGEMSSELKERLEKMETALAAAEKAKNAALADAGDGAQASAALREQITKLESDLAAAQQAAASRAVELAKLQASVASGAGQASELKASLKQAEESAAASSAQVAQLQRDNEALSLRVAAAGEESSALNERLQKLETTLAAVEEAKRVALADAGSGAQERATLREQITKLENELAAAQAAAKSMERERDILASRTSSLELRPDLTAAELEQERQNANTRLQRAEEGRLDALGRAAEFEKELAALKTEASSKDGLLDLKNRLERAQKDTDAAMRQAEQIRAERDTLASQVAERERERAELRAEITRLEQGKDAAERIAASAQERVGTLESVHEELTAVRSELDRERAMSVQRQKDNEVLASRVAQLQRDADGAAQSSTPSADAVLLSGLGTPEQMLTRIDKLDRRVLELESERNAARQAAEMLGSQLADAKQLRDDTLARFQDVVSQLNAVREERDRLTRANAALQAEARASARSSAAQPVIPVEPSAAGGDSGGFLERFLASINGANPEGGAKAAEAMVSGFEVSNVEAASGRERATLNGRVFRPGETVDAGQGLVLERIESRRLTFKDRSGNEYRRDL